jgi:hypothetical protein
MIADELFLAIQMTPRVYTQGTGPMRHLDDRHTDLGGPLQTVFNSLCNALRLLYTDEYQGKADRWIDVEIEGKTGTQKEKLEAVLNEASKVPYWELEDAELCAIQLILVHTLTERIRSLNVRVVKPSMWSQLK